MAEAAVGTDVVIIVQGRNHIHGIEKLASPRLRFACRLEARQAVAYGSIVLRRVEVDVRPLRLSLIHI